MICVYFFSPNMSSLSFQFVHIHVDWVHEGYLVYIFFLYTKATIKNTWEVGWSIKKIKNIYLVNSNEVKLFMEYHSNIF